MPPNFIPFHNVYDTIREGLVVIAVRQWVLNMLLFAPLGSFMPMASSRLRTFRKTFFVLSMFILAIETVQYFIGRTVDINDYIANALGASLGFWLFVYLDRRFRGRRRWRQMKGE